MGKILNFPSHKSHSYEVVELKKVSDNIDSILIDALENKGLEPFEVAGLLAHRLGTFMRPIEFKKELWRVCKEVIKKEAAIDS